MTNSFHEYKNQGAATLLMTVVAVVLITLVLVFAANYGILQDKSNANLTRQTQAFYAADAGMEYAINYLQVNSTTITANPVNGYISYTNASLTNVALANGSKYSVTYTNPVQNNYQQITIASTGTNSDGTASATVHQLLYAGSVFAHPPTMPLLSTGTVSLGGNASVKNTSSGTTIQSGSSVSISGNGETILSSGVSSTAGNVKSDVQQNVASLSGESSSNFFASVFGVPASTVQNDVAHYYSSSSNTDYSSTLNGMSGTSIWINQTANTATIDAITTIGSAANPVFLIVDGNLSMSGNVTIYGFVYVSGTTTTSIAGNVVINGGFSAANNSTFAGNVSIVYSPSIMSALQSQSGMSYYAKVLGSWKDF